MPMYDITTGTGDFIANGVVSHNCFARPTHTYLGFDAGRDFEREIVVKVNAPEVLTAELARRSWKGEHVALGTNTDPYQWVEGRYRLMEGIWEALRDAANPCSILTKSPLLLRDLKLMLEISERATFTACLSIPTLDEKVWRETEPHTPSPRARLEAVAELNRAGIPTGVLIAPLMPGINDAPHQVEPLLERAAEAGATNIAGTGLHLRGEVRQVFFDWLRHGAGPAERYGELYRRGANLPQHERERLARMSRRGGTPGPSGASVTRSEPIARTPSPSTCTATRLSCSRACSERSALLALAGLHVACDLVAARSGAETVAASSGAMPREDAREAKGQRCDVDLAAVLLDRRDDGRGDILGRACADPGGSSTLASANMPASRMKPGKTARDTDAAGAKVGAQGAGEAAQPELGCVVDRGARRGGLARERGDEDSWPRPALDQRGRARGRG